MKARIESDTIFMNDMSMKRSTGIIDESIYQQELDIWKVISMELKGFGTLNDPKGNIKIASKFALAKEINRGGFDRTWIESLVQMECT